MRDAFLTEMDDSELEAIFSVWTRPEVTQLINEFGDIENPIPLGIKMLKEAGITVTEGIESDAVHLSLAEWLKGYE